MQITPYLFFNGNCEQAIAFYLQATEGELLFKMTFGDMPEDDDAFGSASDRAFPPEQIMHAHLRIGQGEIMMSDGKPEERHAGYAVSLSTPDQAQGKQWFDNLSAGGTITKAWAPTFWANGFGMFIDKFGILWMINAYKSRS